MPVSISGWCAGGCGHAEQPVQFRENPRQRAAVAQGFDKALRPRFAQGTHRFRPDPLRHQVVDFTAGDHGPHQVQRFRRDPEAQRRVAGAEAGNAENAHRVFGERRRDMAQPAGFEIAGAVVRVDQVTARVAGHGIDGQIAAPQVVFQRDFRRGVNAEPMVAGRGLALGAGQRILLVRVRVQEYRKILADRPEAARQQLVRRGPDHHPVTLPDRQL